MTATNAAMNQPHVDDMFREAFALHQAGDLTAAKALYEKIIAAKPDDTETLNNLGILHLQLDNPPQSARFIAQSLAIDPNQPHVHNSYGNALQAMKRYDAALASYDKAIALEPNEVNAHYNRACLLGEMGRFEEAMTEYDFAISLRGDDARMHAQRGAILFYLNRHDEAFESYDRAIALEPSATFYQDKASMLMGVGRVEEALDYFDKAVAMEPESGDIQHQRAQALLVLGRGDEAVAAHDKAIALQPNIAEGYLLRAGTLDQLKRYQEALDGCYKAIALAPSLAEAYVRRGDAFTGLKRLDEALKSYEQAIALDPNSATGREGRAYILARRGRYGEAITECGKAIALAPQSVKACRTLGSALFYTGHYEDAVTSFNRAILLDPAFAETYSDRAVALLQLHRFEEALGNLDVAAELDPTAAAVHSNRGNVLKDFNRLDEAMASYERAIELQPDLGDAYWNKAMLHLLLGDFDQGWKLYEWRWKAERMQSHHRTFPKPLWLGEASIAGKTLLVHTEQGFGDFVQCCRYVPVLESMGAKVIVEAPMTLIPFISTVSTTATYVPKGMVLPAFDLHCPIMSLPLALKTTVESVPAVIPYLFVSAPKRKAWAETLGEKTKPRVGIAWSGSATHGNDFTRSIPFSRLEPLLKLPFEFHALQKEIRVDDAANRHAFADKVKIHADALQDFMDAAALVEAMDIVITVDTVIAHIAGALGKPVWLMLAQVPDYRWMLEREDTPWYPTARLFRQTKGLDWAGVIERVTKALPGALKDAE